MVSFFFKILGPWPWGKTIPQSGRIWNHQEYADSAAELVKLRREAKVNGNFFVEPEAIFQGDDGLGVNHGNPKQVARNPLLTFVWDEIAFCTSRCNILILQSGLTVLVSPATAVALRGQASFCRSHCGNH